MTGGARGAVGLFLFLRPALHLVIGANPRPGASGGRLPTSSSAGNRPGHSSEHWGADGCRALLGGCWNPRLASEARAQDGQRTQHKALCQDCEEDAPQHPRQLNRAVKTLCRRRRQAYMLPRIKRLDTTIFSKLDSTRPKPHEKVPRISSSIPLMAMSEVLWNIF